MTDEADCNFPETKAFETEWKAARYSQTVIPSMILEENSHVSSTIRIHSGVQDFYKLNNDIKFSA